jgi:hypothetical protein
MITPVRISSAQKKTALAVEALKQGQYVYLGGSDGTPVGNSTPFIEVMAYKVDSTTYAQYDAGQLFCAMQYPADMEYGDLTYEDIAINSQIVLLDGPGIEIEDDQLYSRVPHSLWASQTPGTKLSLTVSGYPTFVNGPGYDSGISANFY